MKSLPNLSQYPLSVVLCLCTLAALLAPVLAFPGDDDPAEPSTIRALKIIRKDRMPQDEHDQMTGGYYEDLFTFSNRTISTNRLTTGKWATNWTKFEPLRTNAAADQRLQSFLYYEPRPNLDQPEFNVRFVTNSHGMTDREYSLERPPGVWRVAFMGDSLTRGLGASFGKNYESLLEERLNVVRPVSGVEKYEFLNFAVGGYRPTQLLWVLQNKAAAFQPQVNVVALTNLSFARWEAHIVQLVHDGIDLHYPFLKDIVEKAGVRPDDDAQMFASKLEPYRDEVLRWVLQSMKTSSEERGAALLVILVPLVTDPETLRAGFAEVKSLVESLDIPVIDASDTFVGIDDLTPYRLSARNQHETDLGQKVLEERIFERLQQNRRAWNIIAGTGATATTAAPQGQAVPAK